MLNKIIYSPVDVFRNMLKKLVSCFQWSFFMQMEKYIFLWMYW
jgi:hypothetical protein